LELFQIGSPARFRTINRVIGQNWDKIGQLKKAVSNSKKIKIKLRRYNEHITPSSKEVREFKQIYKQEYDKKLTNKQAWESATNLLQFIAILINIEYEEELRKRKLKRHPEGFHLSKGKVYFCPICNQEIEDKNSWYDDCGFKCIICQRALDKKVLPKYVFEKDLCYWDSWQLKDKFGLHYNTVQKLIKEKKLKSRIIRTKNGGIHHQIFVKKENPYLDKFSKKYR
jgi:rubrerythrin